MLQSMVIALLYTFLLVGFDPALSDSNKFVTGAFYNNKNYQVDPYFRKRDVPLAQCMAMCTANASCFALSYNGLCSPVCNLFSTNYCKSKAAITSATSYKLWDKVTTTMNLTCWDQSTIPACIQQKQFRCAACSRAAYHGWACNIRGRGCPGNYEFYNGSCYQVSSDARTYSDANQQCAVKNGGRLVSVRNQFINRFLSIWLGGATDTAYIGADASNATWRRSDNVSRDEWKYQPWSPGEPNGLIESAVVMKGYNWSDVVEFESLSYLCEYEESDCSGVNMSGILPSSAYFLANGSDDHCYLLVTGQPRHFYGAKNACLALNMSLVGVRDMEQHLFLVDFLRNHSSAAVAAGVYVGVFVNSSNPNGYYLDESAVAFDAPWKDGEPDFLRQNTAVLWSNGSWSDNLPIKPRRYVCEYIAPSCGQWRRYQHGLSDEYRVLPRGTVTDFAAQCDMNYDKGGWTVILARTGDRSVLFNRTSLEYDQGFGNVFTDYWIGNDNIYLLTLQEKVELAIALQNFDGKWYFVRYSSFNLTKTNGVYSIGLIGQFISADGVEDVLSVSRGQAFATTDGPVQAGADCASTDGGGWWFPVGSGTGTGTGTAVRSTGCGGANLNAPYGSTNSSSPGGAGTLRWGSALTVKGARMMLRQTTFEQSVVTYF